MRSLNLLCFIAFALLAKDSSFADTFGAARQISSSDFSGAETIVTFYGTTTNGFDAVTPEGVSIRTANGTPGIGFSHRNLPGRTGPSEPTALGNFYGLDQSSGYDALSITFPSLFLAWAWISTVMGGEESNLQCFAMASNLVRSAAR